MQEYPVKWLRDNGLTIVLAAATLITLVGMTMTGLSVYNDELARHHQPAVTLAAYLKMSAYVVLTAFLFQRGSAESNDPDETAAQDEDPAEHAGDRNAPLPVRLGGIPRTLYSYSLGIALFALFLLSFGFHLYDSAVAEAVEAVNHGEPAPTIWQHAGSAQFWFESFQNWQSEFLSTAVLVVLSIFLRFRGSPESKPVAAPHTRTGE
jgi:hypothetical protein